MNASILSANGVTKAFAGVLALDRVDFAVRPGEVVGLVGENGAGKSTLMKILGGILAPDAGSVGLDGVDLPRLTVASAMAGGIAFVHQELNLFDNLTVAANVMIGREPVRGGPLRLVDDAALERRTAPLLAQLGADFAPRTPLSRLSLAQMQLVEIAKALSLQARVVIMDEPTSSLTASETDRLLDVIGHLKARGVAVVLITHRLGEIERCADRVVILRDGRRVAELAGDAIRADTMIAHMIGRDLKTLYRAPAAPPGPAILELRALRTPYRPERPVHLTVHRGEILGLAGLVGAGRTELARAIFGIDRPLAGEIVIDGRPVAIASPDQAIAQGLYLIPEDRKRLGLMLDFPIRQNVSMAMLAGRSAATLVDLEEEEAVAARERDRLGIRAASLSLPAGALSGGNQQKVVLAKWLALSPRILVFDEPTRGVDVGAKSEIYRIMRELSDAGVGILMISSDMEEIIGVSDGVAVMHEGAIAGLIERDGLSEEAILSLAVGRRTR